MCVDLCTGLLLFLNTHMVNTLNNFTKKRFFKEKNDNWSKIAIVISMHGFKTFISSIFKVIDKKVNI